MHNLQGKRVLVVGLARSGRAAAEFLHRRGAVVTVSDSRPPWSFAPEIQELLSRKIGIEFGQHGTETFLRQDLIVASPGVPWDLGALVTARERGIPVVAEVEAASWFLKGSLVGVTGSNGKTTTTTLIGRMLEQSDFQVFVGGNIGRPLISAVEQATEESVSVAELSSFQLEGTESLHPQVAVVLNITPNHLDRHPSFEGYVEAKARILRNQTEDDYAVLNADDPAAAGLAERSRARKLFFSRTRELPEGLLVSQGKVVYRIRHLQRELFSPQDVKLRGEFNLENVLAASAAASVLGADFEAIARAVRDFRGVEHRLEYAGDVLGVGFYNDSKATSVDAVLKALGAFQDGVHLILGGKDKGAPYAPLIPFLKDRVREVLLIGAAADRIGRELAESVAGMVELVQAGDLETAVRKAFGKARPGEVILLSPACASFDQFHDFEDRGRKFKELVEALAQEGQAARARRFWIEPPPSAHEARTRPAPRADGPESRTAPVLGDNETLLPVNVAAVEAHAAQVRALKESLAGRMIDGVQAALEAAQPESGLAPNHNLEPPEPVDEAAMSEAAKEATPKVEGKQGNVAAVRQADSPEHLTATRLALDETRTPRTQPLSQPERIYVYEVEAEERAPMDLAGEVSIDDVILNRSRELEPKPDLGSSPGGGRRGLLPDEPLMFEVPTGGDESANRAALSDQVRSIRPLVSGLGEAGLDNATAGRPDLDPRPYAASVTGPKFRRGRVRRGTGRAEIAREQPEKQPNGKEESQKKLPGI